jgi:hypothetical protein
MYTQRVITIIVIGAVAVIASAIIMLHDQQSSRTIPTFNDFLTTRDGQPLKEAIDLGKLTITNPKYHQYDVMVDTRILVKFEISEQDFGRLAQQLAYQEVDDASKAFPYWREPPTWWKPEKGKTRVYQSEKSPFVLAYDWKEGTVYLVHPQT